MSYVLYKMTGKCSRGVVRWEVITAPNGLWSVNWPWVRSGAVIAALYFDMPSTVSVHAEFCCKVIIEWHRNSTQSSTVVTCRPNRQLLSHRSPHEHGRRVSDGNEVIDMLAICDNKMRQVVCEQLTSIWPTAGWWRRRQRCLSYMYAVTEVAPCVPRHRLAIDRGQVSLAAWLTAPETARR